MCVYVCVCVCTQWALIVSQVSLADFACLEHRKPALFFVFIFVFIFANQRSFLVLFWFLRCLAYRKPALCRHTLAFLVPISVVNANKFYITTHNCNSLQSTQSDCQHMLASFVCQMRRRIHACMSNEEEDTCMSAHVSIICNLTTN